MATDLVPAQAQLPDRSEVDQRLAELAIRGESETLLEVATQARAYQEYERRNDAKERANEFGRMKILAEAHIGLIDLKETPSLKYKDDLQLGEHVIRRVMRNEWRLLGASLQMGRLEPILDDLGNDPREVMTTYAARLEIRRRGYSWFRPRPLRQAYVRRKKSEKLTHAQIADAAGLPLRIIERYLSPRADKVPFSYAIRIALVLGVDLEKLEPVPSSLRPKQGIKQRRRRPKARKLIGGRLDETYSLIRKALQELDRVAGSSGKYGTAEAWEHLFRAEEIVGAALRKAPVK